ncbi:putative lipooligosaccharide transport system, permease component (LptG family) [Campylobacter iguaniorum]|uniref:Putative lipooligosaccharide transport system, permease component (LptG family) n=1 Tax=Campylobacter iguaniorum TaxID=1244531 RepID=A0A076F9G3_9BACT|nr:LptF/LptG family permease [Campylobacter iguaniorum]AII14157.1 putative lipooligosaccharide transport system, permease component (LptG family) [Campylobacter iguaniorum]
MKLFLRYTGWVYIKYFVIIFIALELFYVGIDTLTNLKDLPKSANLQLIYVGLTALTAINYVLPLSLVFALIVAKINMIRNNELVSFYSLGIPKNSLILAPFSIALLVTFCYILLSATPFAYARDYQKNLMSFQSNSKSSNSIFLKYEDKFIYIQELYPNLGLANNIRIFNVQNHDITGQITAQKAKFENNKWKLLDVNIIKLPANLELNTTGYIQSVEKELTLLNGFKPKTIENIYQTNSSYSISDALDSLKTLKNEGINLGKIKSTLYSATFFPLFAPLMVLILYYYLPITGRFFNLALASFIYVIVTLCIWGVLFVLIRFSSNGVIMPEIGIIAPIILLGAFAFKKFYENR